MRMCRGLIHSLVATLFAMLCATAGPRAQTPNLVQPWGLPPLPPGVGPVEKFADVSGTPQGQFLEGGAFDTQGNLWFVAIGSGWVSYLTPDGKLVPVFNCNPAPELGQTCEPQGSRWHDGKLYLTSRHRGILVWDPQTKQLSTLVYTYRNQLFKGPNDLDFDAEGNLYIGCYEPSQILRVSPGGRVDTLFHDETAHTLAHPTNLAFRGSTLFAANLGRWHLTAIEVGLPGLPLRRGAGRA